MPVRKILLILIFCLIVVLSGCTYQSNLQNQSSVTLTGGVEQTSTALAASGVLKTPSFALNTPTVVLTTPIPTETPPISDGSKLAVVMIKEGEVLNVRSNPGDQNGIVTTIAAHAVDIATTGNSQELDGEIWFEIRTADSAPGWVKAGNVTEQVSSTQFCADSKISSLISQFMGAIQSRDGVKLTELVNPRRGLIVRHEWWNPEVQFKGQEILEDIFNDATSHDWGIQDGSGLSINAPFKDEILPKLDDIQTGSVLTCNSLDQGLASGGSAGFIKWPFEYINFNYMAIYRAAAEGDELNWRTWAIGVEYINETPFITLLVQYHWEN